jgi:hypothetical protein
MVHVPIHKPLVDWITHGGVKTLYQTERCRATTENCSQRPKIAAQRTYLNNKINIRKRSKEDGREKVQEKM